MQNRNDTKTVKTVKTNYNQNVNRNINKNQHKNNQNAQNCAAIESVAHNPAVQNASKSAMKDKNVRNAAFNAFKGRGNDPNSNKKLIGALAQNKEVQSAAIE